MGWIMNVNENRWDYLIRLSMGVWFWKFKHTCSPFDLAKHLKISALMKNPADMSCISMI
jgi:hypothetical protein